MKNKRILSFLLSFVMILSLFPINIFAEGERYNGGGNGGYAGAKQTASGNSFHVDGNYANHQGMRISLYFEQGDWNTLEEMREHEATLVNDQDARSKYIQIGDTIELDYKGLKGQGIDRVSMMTVFNRMALEEGSDNMGTDGILGFNKNVDYDSILVTPSEIGLSNFPAPVLSSTNSSNENRYFEYFYGTRLKKDYSNWNEIANDHIEDFKNLDTLLKAIIPDNNDYGYKVDAKLFANGELVKDGTPLRGVYKLYLEPTQYLVLNGNKYVVTMRDLIAYDNGTTTTYKFSNGEYDNIRHAFYTLLNTVGNSLHLTEDEFVVRMKGKNVNYEAITTNESAWTNYTLSAGLATLTGFPYQGRTGPKVIKTYFALESVDSSGKAHWVKAAESEEEDAKFWYDGLDQETSWVMFDDTVKIEGFKGVLNDIFTTQQELSKTDNTQWVDTPYPVGLSEPVSDSNVVDYNFNIVLEDVDYQKLIAEEIDRQLDEKGFIDGSIGGYSYKDVMINDIFIAAMNTAENKLYNEEIRKDKYLTSFRDIISETVTFYLSNEMYDYRFEEKPTDEEITKVVVSTLIPRWSRILNSNIISHHFKTIAAGQGKFNDYVEVAGDGNIAQLGYVYLQRGTNGEVLGYEHVAGTQDVVDSISSVVRSGADWATAAMAGDIPTQGNQTSTMVLRYLMIPDPIQKDVIEIRERGTNKVLRTLVGETQPLNINTTTNTVTIDDPIYRGLDQYGSAPELDSWATSPQMPIVDISNGVLPTPPSNGKSGGNTGRSIPSYPEDPITHNLYVKWVIYIDTTQPNPVSNSGQYHVPEWRLSKLFDENVVLGGTTSMSLALIECERGLYPTGFWRYYGTEGIDGMTYKMVNPNGQVLEVDSAGKSLHNPLNLKMDASDETKWLHAEAVSKNEKAYVSVSNTDVSVGVGVRLNGIKTTYASQLKLANWINPDASTIKTNYDIDSASKNNGSKQDYPMTPSEELKFQTRNQGNYIETYHKHITYNPYDINSDETSYLYFLPTTPSTGLPSGYTTAEYEPYKFTPTITFDRYNQQDTTALKVDPEIKEDSKTGYTTIKYQATDDLKIYPEYGMWLEEDASTGVNDTSHNSIKWVVSDKERHINPVVYSTLQYKLYVTPNVTGTSVATDTRALAKARALGESGLQVIYKGAGANPNFKITRANNNSNNGILTAKTFVLDIADSVKTAWGDNAYNAKSFHDNLNDTIKATSKADATEKLIIESLANYNGAEVRQKSADYKEAGNGFFTHKLVVRGGAVIGVWFDNSNGNGTPSYDSKPKTMAELKAMSDTGTDRGLYEALINMNLYDESGNRDNTVLKVFEHKAENADVLNEGEYATMLARGRAAIDKISTPASSAINNGDKWYSEDSTVLLIREYATNYNVPSISFSDKISMTVNGLNTPVNKNDFFSQMKKGYTYVKYDLGLSANKLYSPVFINTNQVIHSMFEFDSLTGNFGKQGSNYLVPNVSITDTTRLG